MEKIPILILCSLLTSCYYERESGCMQHLLYKECPYIDTNTLEKIGMTTHQRYLDYDDCTKRTQTKETLFQCMIDKGYKPTIEQK